MRYTFSIRKKIEAIFMYHHKPAAFFALLLTTLLLAGCKANPSYILPNSTTEPQLQATHTTPATTTPTEYTTVPTEPTTVETQPLDPVPTDPKPTETNPTDPKPTDPEPADHFHSYTKAVIDPTCEQKGYTGYTCSCGHSYKDHYTDALGHQFRTSTVAPTATAKGYDLHECTRCGTTYKDHYTDKLPAESQPKPTDPKPTEPEPTKHAHSYTKTVVNPTCTDEGYTEYLCNCGDRYTADKKKALGHDYKVTVVIPTVEHQGYNLHECTRCGDSYKDTYIDKLPSHTEPPETEPPKEEPPKYDHPVYDISDHSVGSLEYEILAQINARRAAEGLSELKISKKLCALSTIRAYEITISFSHTRPDDRSCVTVLTDYKFGCSMAGENLLYASSSYSASQLVDVWMGSTNHRSNILNPDFSKAGIGVWRSGGLIYVANFFAN
jgi:uncharacterized protein YkwD